ncbi:type I toxin-antitoxin system Fst family toxin [Latilactobacillus fragifolii]
MFYKFLILLIVPIITSVISGIVNSLFDHWLDDRHDKQ